MLKVLITALLLAAGCFRASAAGMPTGKTYVNSLGMRLVRIEPGSFEMGEANTLPDKIIEPLTYPTRNELKKKFPHGDPGKFVLPTNYFRHGDFDERPVHKVIISHPFYMGSFEVTNAQYEQFDPSHHALRGKHGLSKGDNEAVIFVSWYEANAFCDWLSKKEGLPYRLPTEAEWEYAARAGTTTLYWTGNSLPAAFPKDARSTSFRDPQDIVDLTVGKTPPNPWGLFDVHGNVEEWTHDWYGPYVASDQTDPVGRADGNFKVTRGGSFGTVPYYLRSANRMGTVPGAKSWLIGFRVVLGGIPHTRPMPSPEPERYQQNVRQNMPNFAATTPDPDKPYFIGPKRFVKIPAGDHGPLFPYHNHDTAITVCPNGDLLAIWFTCAQERGRELGIAVSRLPYGAKEWEPASSFWDAPDRNDSCPALWNDGKGTIYQFNGLGVAEMWEPLAIIMRTSKDNGVTWSKARLIAPEFGFRDMVGQPVFRTKSGAIVFGADADHGSTIWVSRDGGKTWNDPGGHINGIHAGIVQMRDGRLMALGRGENIDGWMPKSISSDMGKTWTATASPMPPIDGGQRLVLMRLKEGPLLLASYAKNTAQFEPVSPRDSRSVRSVTSLFAALSFDDGKTWPVRRVISDGLPEHGVTTIDGGRVRMSKNSSEPLGYLSACEGRDGVVHLLSSINYYAFNLAWLKQGQPTAPRMPSSRRLPIREHLAQVYSSGDLGRFEVSRNKWSMERTGLFDGLDLDRGFTVEAHLRIPEREGRDAGVSLELYARGGPLTANHYLLRLTSDGIYYWYDQKFRKIAEPSGTPGAVHTYRLAVREDSAAQIYRDGRELSVQPADLVIDWRQPARGSYLDWRTSGGSGKPPVDSIGIDLSGSYQPGKK